MKQPRLAIYLTHPDVVIEPDVPVAEWRLSEAGRARVLALADRLTGLDGAQIVASAERKALDTAAPLAARSGRPTLMRPRMHENDRSATGYLPRAEFEAVADAFFAAPEVSVRGWETAARAQARIVAEVRAAMAQAPERTLILAGHGAVGTLLFCHLSDIPIDRKWDQPGCGHWFAFDTGTGRPRGPWAPLEALHAI